MVSLVTGGAGFIGSHVACQLLDSGHRVVVLDDLSGGFLSNVDARADFVHGSILDHQFVDDLFTKYQFDYVFHLAAYAAEGLSHYIRRFNYQNNVTGSVNLINSAVKHQVKCFVFTSSIAVYGEQESPVMESATPHPIDPYGISKYTVEMDLRCAHKTFGLNYIIFRLHNVYGERQNLRDPYRNVVGIFINQIRRNQSLTIYGDGSQTRAFSHIDDASSIIAHSVNNKKAYGEVFNLGSDEHYSISHLATLVMTAMGKRQPIKHLSERHEVKHAFADHQKVKSVFEVPYKTSLEHGLQRMAEWAKLQPIASTIPMQDIELPEFLPEHWR